MKALLKGKSTYVLLLSIALLLACNKQSENPDGPINPFAEEINDHIRQLPEWKNENIEPTDSTLIEDVKIQSNGIPYKCDIYEKNLVRTLQDIISVETNFGVIWPGALIQGNSLEGGELEPINVDRSQVTIQTNIPLNESYTVVEKPNSITIQQAISDFQIAAGQMPEGSEAGAGLMNFSIEEAASFNQAMLAMGISGGFTEPQSQVGLEASANVSVERSYSEHTVIAKFVQEMFTVRLADDLLAEPSDFFAPDVTLTDMQALVEKGEMGSENIPLYIESVTYGRIMLFTMKSTNVSSAAELSAAVNVSMQDYVEGESSLSAGQREILENSTTTIFSAGGTKDAANAAIATLNWSEYFKSAPATTAVPISFVAKTLNGKKIVKIVDNAVYEQRSTCQEPSSYNITVEWTDSDNTGLCSGGLCPRQVFVKSPKTNIGTQLTVLNSYTNNMIFDTGDINTDLDRSFDITSIVELLLPAGIYSTKINEESYDILELNNGNNIRTHLLQNYAGSVTLTFNIRKVTHYD
jgi:hypothetical protein